MKSLKLTTSLILIVTSFFVVSCASPTPQTRIEKNPQIFSSLPKKHQALVAQGQIAKGMTPPAVFLAWGAPHRKSGGYRNNRNFERWTYTSSRADTLTTYHAGFGYGYGRYGRYGRGYGHGYGLGFAPQIVSYRDVPYAHAEFVNGKVVEWARATR